MKITESEYVEGLYFPATMRADELNLKEFLRQGRFEQVDKTYSGKSHIPIILFETKGNGDRESVSNILSLYADFGHIGDEWGLAYVYNEDKSIAYPRKFLCKAHRILIDRYR